MSSTAAVDGGLGGGGGGVTYMPSTVTCRGKDPPFGPDPCLRPLFCSLSEQTYILMQILTIRVQCNWHSV